MSSMFWDFLKFFDPHPPSSSFLQNKLIKLDHLLANLPPPRLMTSLMNIEQPLYTVYMVYPVYLSKIFKGITNLIYEFCQFSIFQCYEWPVILFYSVWYHPLLILPQDQYQLWNQKSKQLQLQWLNQLLHFLLLLLVLQYFFLDHYGFMIMPASFKWIWKLP